MTMKAFEVLGVAPGATVAEIKAAYRERAMKIHPDRFAGDPRSAEAAHRAFVELNDAFRTALASARLSSALTTPAAQPVPGQVPVQVRVPQQRSGAATYQRSAASSRTAAATAAPVSPAAAAKRQDPILELLTVPQRCGRPWSAQALEVWALAVIPESRQHLSEAKRLARASGARSPRHLTTAAAHALLTLTVKGINGPRIMGVLGQLDAAYAALEIVLPGEVVDRLPARVTVRRTEPVEEPGRTMLAFFAASGALAAATLWTHFFGFFAA